MKPDKLQTSKQKHATNEETLLRIQMFARARNICLSETFCVRNKCFPVCSPKHLRSQQCFLVCHGLNNEFCRLHDRALYQLWFVQEKLTLLGLLGTPYFYITVRANQHVFNQSEIEPIQQVRLTRLVHVAFVTNHVHDWRIRVCTGIFNIYCNLLIY